MSYEQIKELLLLHQQAINANIKAGNDMIELKLQEVIKHQKETNGRVNYLEQQTKFARLIQEYPKISFTVLVLFILVIGVIGAGGVYELIKSLV